MRIGYTRSLSISACLATAVAALATASPTSLNAQAKPQGAVMNVAAISAVRKALDKYKDPVAAVRDGYYSTVGCVDFPSGGTEHGSMEYKPGAMGVHLLNMGNVGPKLDPAKPQVLIYEPVNGKLKLAAAEWFMPVQVAGGKAPTIFGQTLSGPMDGHQPIMPKELRHYDLHVWLWKTNPKGVFTSTNAAVKCPAGDPYTFAEGVDGHMHH